MKARIAVVISTWNRRDLVVEAVDSILNQATPAHVEMQAVVVDDGSTDGTADALANHYELTASGSDPNLYRSGRVTLIAVPNRERGSARNTGATWAITRLGAEWLMFLDSDDTLASGAIAGFLDRLESHRNPRDLVCVFANSRLWGGGSDFGVNRLGERESEGDLKRDILERGLFSIGTVLMRASVFQRIGGFPEDRKMAGSEDWVLHARLCFAGSVAYSPHVSLNYRRHAGNTAADRFLESIVQSRLHIEPDLEKAFGEDARAVRRRMWRHAWLSIAGTFNAEGQSRRAAGILTDTFRRDPGLMSQPRFWRLGASIASRILVGKTP